ncbi:unnamed protein product [Caenorhabditis angaria]|uniref:C2H2-type domain-containing protein n=1 Tax=Caenorhabditis angaria TaxID=860376 RepID=A0A9P1N6Q1_9PELO|nr:unnamed protein product [Caenorhabditis angaria]
MNYELEQSPQHQQPHDLRLVDLVGCPECGRSYLQKNIYRHLWNQHNWSREECKQLITVIKSEKKVMNGTQNTYTCDICCVAFKTVWAMMKHRRICLAHQPESKRSLYHSTSKMEMIEEDEIIDPVYIEEEEEEIVINQPSSSTEQSQALDEQIPKTIEKVVSQPKIQDPDNFRVSTVTSRFRQSTIACPLCKKNLETNDELVQHCHLEHETEETKYQLEQQVFPDKQSFREWFDQRQEDTCTSLTKRTGHGGETFYRCHMVGKYSSVAKKRKSNPRKLDQCCTAFLKVYLHPDGSIYASGCFSHIGHELNHKLLWFTESQENYVRELLDLGWNADQIYFYIRDEYENYECKLKYISKNDIRNISVRHERLKRKKQEDPNSSPKVFEEDEEDDDINAQKLHENHQNQ